MQISRDPWILEKIAGVLQCPPAQAYSSGSHEQADIPALDEELKKLAAKQAIERVSDPAEAYFISPMFSVSKSNGSRRPVINLRNPNWHTIARHFKMKPTETAKAFCAKEIFRQS